MCVRVYTVFACCRLRLHTMRGEFSEEFNNPMDETVDNVIEDITRRAGIR